MTIEEINSIGRLEIVCNKCGYKKIITIDPKDKNTEKFLEFQEEKPCPNCGSEHSLSFGEMK